MKKDEELRRERILHVLAEKGVRSAKDIAQPGSSEYMNIYKQLYSGIGKTVSLDVVSYILDKFQDVSADYILRGEGTWERTKIITAPNRQDIHIAGGNAAITQSGDAVIHPDSLDKQDTSVDKQPDIAELIRTNDLGGLVAIIMKQKDEILRLTNQRLEDLERYARIADSQLFPPVK